MLHAPALARIVHHRELERVDAGTATPIRHTSASSTDEPATARPARAGSTRRSPSRRRARRRARACASGLVERSISVADDNAKLVAVDLLERIGNRSSPRSRCASSGDRSVSASSVLGANARARPPRTPRARAPRCAPARHGDPNLVRLAVAIARLGLEAEEVIAGQLEREAIEREVGARRHAKHGAARDPGDEVQPVLAEIDIARRVGRRCAPAASKAGGSSWST